ncbi:MAG: LysR substrate-binding domain-containing protein [Hyphomicrobiales bacterium]|nr:LysR substrate-binding domain-containing protein [Hyphomicrobiales bacterium]
MLQNFSVNWFLPRLRRFNEAFPNVEVRLSFEPHYVDFAREAIDMAVRHSPHDWPDLHCELLFQDQLLPVCSKAYLAAHGPFDKPADLFRHTLLVSDGRPSDAWSEWFRSTGTELGSELATIHVDSSHLAMLAAANGIGFAIAGARLMQPMMRRGELVAPFPMTVPEHGSFFTVCPPGWANRPKIRRMRRWLAEEARQTFDS